MNDHPLMSVVIPTYNRRERLQQVLTALADQDVTGPFEVIVVSDGSTDGTDEYLTGDDLPLAVVPTSQSNAGPAAARNRGIDLARGDIVVFLDDDLVPAPQLLARHLQTHRALGDDVVVIGPMSDPVDHELSPWTNWEQAMLRKQYDAMRTGRWAVTARQFYTANASVRREHLVAAGGFDPKFRRMEDVELAYRLDDLGLRWAFAAEAIGFHYAERSYDAWLAIGYQYGRNDVVFGRDHGRSGVLRTVSAEYWQRHVLLRGLLRLSVPRPRLSAAVGRLVCWFATSSWATRSERLTRSALSCAYNDAYYRGVVDELGGPDQFRELLGTRR